MKFSILMLEHDDDDRFITSKFVQERHPDVSLHYVLTSDDLFKVLHSSLGNPENTPSLILLNQQAQPLNAVEILQNIKSNVHFNHIPVVVLSGSKEPEWIRKCYAAGASSFIQKPDTLEETIYKISSFLVYWTETVETR